MTPTPSFPVELHRNKKWDAIIQAEANKVLKETQRNHVSVGVGSVSKPYSLYQPHNYRLYFDFDKSTFKLPTEVRGSVLFHIQNTTEVCFDNYLDFRIVIKRTQIELTNRSNRWHLIYTEPVEGIIPQIEEVIKELDSSAVIVLKKFMLEFGGHSTLTILNSTNENKVKSESAIDKIPQNLTFRNEQVKKVYMESNVEFSSPVYVANYLSNRAVEAVTPEISARLDSIRDNITRFQDSALNPLTEQIRLHLKVQRETLKTLKAIRGSFESREDKVKNLKREWGW
jgi:hypothetical protein